MAKVVKKTPAPKKKSTKTYKKPPPIRSGEVVTDQCHRDWKIGPSIGVGGFGEIYSACEVGDESSYPYVVKIEPIENGPLFVEEHFYYNNNNREHIENFMKSRNLSHLGMPVFTGKGETTYEGTKLRFLVLERYGTDISKIFKDAGRFPAPTVFQLGLQVLDVLEYIHSRHYIHADIKGANILMGIKNGEENQVYLVDYGLAYRLVDDNYRPNPKNAHEGTLEYTSRDRHIGAQTMRGDLEILAYNMLLWLVGELPWEKIVDPDSVHQMKNQLMNHVRDRITCDYPNVPEELIQFFEYINNLNLEDKPDYTICRRIFEGYLTSVGKMRTSKLEFTSANDNAQISAVKDAINELKLNDDENNYKLTKRISENKCVFNKEKGVIDKDKTSAEDSNSTITRMNRNLSKQNVQNNYSMSPEPKTTQCKKEVIILLTDIKYEIDKIQNVTKNKKSRKEDDKIPQTTENTGNSEIDNSQHEIAIKKKQKKVQRSKSPTESDNASEYFVNDHEELVTMNKITKEKRCVKPRALSLAGSNLEVEIPDENQEPKSSKKSTREKGRKQVAPVTDDADLIELPEIFFPCSLRKDTMPNGNEEGVAKNKEEKKQKNMLLIEQDCKDNSHYEKISKNNGKTKKHKKLNIMPTSENDSVIEVHDDNQEKNDTTKNKIKAKRGKEPGDVSSTENVSESKLSDEYHDQNKTNKENNILYDIHKTTVTKDNYFESELFDNIQDQKDKRKKRKKEKRYRIPEDTESINEIEITNDNQQNKVPMKNKITPSPSFSHKITNSEEETIPLSQNEMSQETQESKVGKNKKFKQRNKSNPEVIPEDNDNVIEELKVNKRHLKNKKKKRDNHAETTLIDNNLEQSDDNFIQKINKKKKKSTKVCTSEQQKENDSVCALQDDTPEHIVANPTKDKKRKLSLLKVSEENTAKKAEVTLTEDANVYEFTDDNEVTKKKKFKKKKDKNSTVDKIHKVKPIEAEEQNVSKKNKKRKSSETVLPEEIPTKIEENTLQESGSENEFLVKIKKRKYYNCEPSVTNVQNKNPKVTSTENNRESKFPKEKKTKKSNKNKKAAAFKYSPWFLRRSSRVVMQKSLLHR